MDRTLFDVTRDVFRCLARNHPKMETMKRRLSDGWNRHSSRPIKFGTAETDPLNQSMASATNQRFNGHNCTGRHGKFFEQVNAALNSTSSEDWKNPAIDRMLSAGDVLSEPHRIATHRSHRK